MIKGYYIVPLDMTSGRANLAGSLRNYAPLVTGGTAIQKIRGAPKVEQAADTLACTAKWFESAPRVTLHRCMEQNWRLCGRLLGRVRCEMAPFKYTVSHAEKRKMVDCFTSRVVHDEHVRWPYQLRIDLVWALSRSHWSLASSIS